jgi:hypothetical protein
LISHCFRGDKFKSFKNVQSIIGIIFSHYRIETRENVLMNLIILRIESWIKNFLLDFHYPFEHFWYSFFCRKNCLCCFQIFEDKEVYYKRYLAVILVSHP